MSIPSAEQLFVDVREMLAARTPARGARCRGGRSRGRARLISWSIARATMSRGASSPRSSIVGHEPFAASPGCLSSPPSPRTASVIRKFLTSQIVEAGRVELHELHVGDPAARPPRHGDSVAGRAARSGRIEIGPARAAGREDGRPRGQRLDPLLRPVVGVEAVNRAAGREMRRVPAGDQVDRDHVGNRA